MLNKELLLATGGQPVEPIKLTVGAGGIGSYGYSAVEKAYGSVSKVPCWNVNGKPTAMIAVGFPHQPHIYGLQGLHKQMVLLR